MKFVLVSHPLCPFAHRAALLLREKRVAHEVRYVDLAEKPPWFLAISPRGKVPLLFADDVVLFESSAIVEFLDETHPPRLVPSNAFERARQRAWVELASDLFLAQHELATATSSARLETQRRVHDAILSRFESELRGRYFTGASFGLVDIATAPALFRIDLVQRWTGMRLLRDFPKVARWTQTIATRPSVTLSVPGDFEERYRSFLMSQRARRVEEQQRGTRDELDSEVRATALTA